jgi:16S rRNA (cytidine1402-2'-O)-methyltransferase
LTTNTAPKPRPERRYAIGEAGFDAPALPPALYVVATPIGNLRDISLRALQTLAGADLVLCEDTRQSARLLDHYGIRTPRTALHEHNERARIEGVLARIGTGEAVALISDAGTPLLSDPGFPLVRAARDAGIDVIAIPGASALLGALASAGLPTDRFTFVGFLPTKQGARTSAIAALKADPGTLVFYESPRRLGKALTALADILGPREAAVALELTKRFERTHRGALDTLAQEFSALETKGEAVILVSGASGIETANENWPEELREALASGSLREAVDEITARHNLKRKQVYDRALAIRDGRD